MATTNAINANSTGLVKYNGTGTFSGVTVTQYNTLVGAASNGITSVAPHATSGTPLISQGAAADPAYGTMAAVGGGTSFTGYTAGDIIYASAANTLSKLAIGSNTNILTVSAGIPAWAAPSGGTGAWTFLASATASASATLDFTTGLTSTYNLYVFIFDRVLNATNTQEFLVRTSTDGGSTYDAGASDYAYSLESNNLTINDITNDNGALGINVINTAGETGVSGFVYLFSPSDATRCMMVGRTGFYDNTDFQETCMVSSNVRHATANVDAVRFFYSSGNITSGTIYLYGIAKTS